MISQAISMAFHPVWCYLFMSVCDYGIIGIGIAGVITDLSVLLQNIGYHYYLQDLRPSFFWPDRRCI